MGPNTVADVMPLGGRQDVKVRAPSFSLGFNNPLRCRYTLRRSVSGRRFVRLSVRLDLPGPTRPGIFLKSPSGTAMPRCSVTRRVHFNAAHRLHNPDRSDEWNRKTFGSATIRTITATTTSSSSPSRGDRSRNRVCDGSQPAQGARRGAAARPPRPQEPESRRGLVPGADSDLREHRPRLLAGAAGGVPADLTLRLRLWETPRNYVDYEGG